MITPANYFEKIQGINFDQMSAGIREGHAFVLDLLNNGPNWEDYYESDAIKETVDIYFTALQKQLDSIKPKATSPKPTKTDPTDKKNPGAKLFVEEEVLKKSKAKEKDTSATTEDLDPRDMSPAAPSSTKKVHIEATEAKQVERVDEELKFIKRYVLMHGKEKTNAQILNFINALQKAILERRIRKTSTYSEQIKYIQDSLIKLYNKMGNAIEIKIRESVLSEMLHIAGSVKVRLSVAYLKRYISMQGKHITREKAEKLLNMIVGALDKEKIAAGDPYMEKMKKVMSSLRAYIKNSEKPDVLHIQEATLNGIQKALDGCTCGQSSPEEESNSDDADQPGRRGQDTVMNSVDFAEMHFDTLGFTGKWLELIGDPSSNFTAMIFGKPKMGKSYLAVNFAGYLARNFGRVLYVAKEEGLDLTLQEKLNQKNVQHINLFVTSSLPDDLNRFAFIFLDSVNSLGLTPEDLRQLRNKYPTKSFICVFQSTKQGTFLGANKFQHDVDVVIEVPEKGKAIQMGRFNQGGQIEIFGSQAA